MKLHIFHLVAATLFMLSLTACGASTQGPSVWIDRPLDGTHFPLASITFQAHASEAEGVGSIQFYVSETLIASIPAGGSRLGEASIDWMPPGPGTYTLITRAIDNHGNYGPQDSVQIVVGEANPAAETSAPEALTSTPKSAAAESTAIPKFAGPALHFAQNANCRTGPGTAYDNVDTMFQGQIVPIEGQNDQSNWFMVKKSSGHGSCWVSIISAEVQGDLSTVPVIFVATVSTRPPVQPPTQQAQDTTPPAISNVSINPKSIQKQGCGTPNTFTIRAKVTDASGVSFVAFSLQGPSPQDAIDGRLTAVGGDVYQAEIGPLQDAGNWSIVLGATDTANNNTQAGPWTIQVICIK